MTVHRGVRLQVKVVCVCLRVVCLPTQAQLPCRFETYIGLRCCFDRANECRQAHTGGDTLKLPIHPVSLYETWRDMIKQHHMTTRVREQTEKCALPAAPIPNYTDQRKSDLYYHWIT